MGTAALGGCNSWCWPCARLWSQRAARGLRLFYGLLALASEMDTVDKPNSKRRSRIITAGKLPSYRRRRTERTASEDPLTTAWDMRRVIRLVVRVVDRDAVKRTCVQGHAGDTVVDGCVVDVSHLGWEGGHVYAVEIWTERVRGGVCLSDETRVT